MAERTPEEREAARLERERRRGRVDAAAAPPEHPEVAGPPDVIQPEAAYDGSGHGDHFTDDADEHFTDDTDEHFTDDTDEHEFASGTRRVGWRERSAAVTTHSRGRRRPPPRARTRTAPAGPAATPSRRRSIIIRALAVAVLVIAAAVIWFGVKVFQPFSGSGHGRITVTIPPRLGAQQVGDLLARDGVISSGFYFYIRATLDGDRGKLFAGTYHLKLGMSYGQVLKILTTPPPAVKVTNVTIVPGDTRQQVGARLRAEGVKGSYLASTISSPLLPFSAYRAPSSARSLEGFLYPDTYQLRAPVSITTLVADQLTRFKQVFSGINMSYARARGLTPYDVLIIASIVEREASTARDRPLVASVIYNRLRENYPLGMDSTVRYAFNDYNKPLTNAQLSTPSPYNTRLHTGLPPTPIDSPGLASLQAAAHPPTTNYLYFVVRPCGNGEMTFTSSYHQFLADSAAYQQARSARGGKSPTKC